MHVNMCRNMLMLMVFTTEGVFTAKLDFLLVSEQLEGVSVVGN